MSKITKVVGPSTATFNRAEAIEQLYSHKGFPKNARLADIEEENGKWVATLKFADFPFSDDGQGGSDDEGSKPPKKNKNDFDGPNGDNSDEPVEEDGSDDSGSDSDSDSKDDSKKGEKGELGELKTLLEGIATALGIPVPGAEGDSPIPGQDGADAAGPPLPPPPPGAGAPPHGGPAGPPPHALHPGDAPPGATPIGAPAFASVRVANPFPEHIGQQKAFEISDITDKPLGDCIREIRAMVEPFGYYVHQCKASHTNDGNRRVAALVADHRPKIG